MTETNKKELSLEQQEELLGILQARFEKNMQRHQGLEWGKVQAKAGGSVLKNCGRSMKWKEPVASQML